VVIVTVNLYKPNNVDVVIGDGPSGAKSTQLQKRKPLIDSNSEFGYAPFVAVTPLLYKKEFLVRIGASHEKPGEAMNAIDKAEFGKPEKEAHAELLHQLGSGNVAIRSDECDPSGNGLWKGKLAYLSGNPEEDAKTIDRAVRTILKSEYSENVIAFKRRVGLSFEETPGVFCMQMSLQNMNYSPKPGENGYLPTLTTPFHFNVMTQFAGENRLLLAGGVGIGGANQPLFTKIIYPGDCSWKGTEVERGLMEGFTMLSPDMKVFYKNNVVMLMDADKDMDRVGWWASLAGEAIEKVVRGCFEIAESAGIPLYLEIAGAYPKRRFSVVQAADGKPYRKVTLPDVPKNSKIFEARDLDVTGMQFGSKVSGNLLEKVGGVFYLKDIFGIPELGRVNSETRNYLIISDISQQVFNEEFGLYFAKYSNTAAVTFTKELYGGANLASHLNGAMREAGIAVMQGSMDPMYLRKLKPNSLNQANLLVAASELDGRGFAAEI